jgi:hypothetical protein
MPQFDKITFFNQVFWLFLFFSGFYLILLTDFLPKISSVLKARNKKLQKGTEDVVFLLKEQDTVTNLFNLFFRKTSFMSKASLTIYSEFFCIKFMTMFYLWCLFFQGCESIEETLRLRSVIVLTTKNDF